MGIGLLIFLTFIFKSTKAVIDVKTYCISCTVCVVQSTSFLTRWRCSSVLCRQWCVRSGFVGTGGRCHPHPQRGGPAGHVPGQPEAHGSLRLREAEGGGRLERGHEAGGARQSRERRDTISPTQLRNIQPDYTQEKHINNVWELIIIIIIIIKQS